jgi:cobaltochelatase CobN
VAIITHRIHWTQGSTAWLDQWIRRFEVRGIVAFGVFVSQINEQKLNEVLGDPASGKPPRVQAIVLNQLLTRGVGLQPLWARWGIPVVHTMPWRAGNEESWQGNASGVPLNDVPFYFSQPEASGAVDPMVVVGTPPGASVPELIERQANAVVHRVDRLIRLAATPRNERALHLMVYAYPQGGQHFGASFLNVPRSLARVSDALSVAGYRVEARSEQYWIESIKPLMTVGQQPNPDLLSLLRAGQAHPYPVARYRERYALLPEPVRQRIEKQWGPPEASRFVAQWRGELVFVIPRVQAGALTVLPQPAREETVRSGAELIRHQASVPVSHSYLATYAWAGESSALIHFGTHGTQEWAMGKARGLDVNDDALLPLADLAGHVPVVYPYIVDNLGEAITAKRRGRAVLISHKTPVLSPAGFSPAMGQLHEWMHEWEVASPGRTRNKLTRKLIGAFIDLQLHRDLGWTRTQIEKDFEGFLEILHPYLDDLAQSSQPLGLAVFGQPPSASARRLMLLQALREPLLRALAEDLDEAYLIDSTQLLNSRPARWLEQALVDATAASKLDLRTSDTTATAVPNREALKPTDPKALRALAEQAQQLDRALASEGELSGLIQALDGKFVEASLGGDPFRVPESLPTGRNMVGFDPNRLPTPSAYASGVELLEQWIKEHPNKGNSSGPLVIVLWAGETLRHQGLMESKALAALGVHPIWDSNGRPTGVRWIDDQALKRPRFDVVLSVSGSYRDQFPGMLKLFDEAVALQARDAPKGPVAINQARSARELIAAGYKPAVARELAQVRVFGNAPEQYGTSLPTAIGSDALSARDARLGTMFIQAMGHGYLNGEAVSETSARAQQQVFKSHLARAQGAVLSRSSHLYSLLSSDDPFQYLGGLAAAARTTGRGSELALSVVQAQAGNAARIDTASRAMALELQSRVLHPAWLAAQRDEGYAGTLQALKAVQFVFGWQALTRGVVRPDQWASISDVLLADRHQLGTQEWLASHADAKAQIAERLMQAARLGYWAPTAVQRELLAQSYRGAIESAKLTSENRFIRKFLDQRETSAVPPDSPVVSAKPQETVSPAQTEQPLREAIELRPIQRFASPSTSSVTTWLGIIVAALLVALGAFQVAWRAPRTTGV